MTPQQIVALAVRVFAIWLLVISVQMIGIALTLSGQFRSDNVFALFAVPALPVFLAVFLWKFPSFVAGKLLPRTTHPDELRMPPRADTAAASAIIGLWVVVAVLPQAFAVAAMAIYSRRTDLFDLFFTPDRVVTSVALAVQVVLGIFLLARPWLIARWIFPLPRGAGGAPDAAPPASGTVADE